MVTVGVQCVPSMWDEWSERIIYISADTQKAALEGRGNFKMVEMAHYMLCVLLCMCISTTIIKVAYLLFHTCFRVRVTWRRDSPVPPPTVHERGHRNVCFVRHGTLHLPHSTEEKHWVPGQRKTCCAGLKGEVNGGLLLTAFPGDLRMWSCLSVLHYVLTWVSYRCGRCVSLQPNWLVPGKCPE